MLYRVTRSGTFLDVFLVEAKSPEDAVKKWESGKEVGEGNVLVEGTTAVECEQPAPPAAKAKKKYKPRKKKAEAAPPAGDE